MSPERMGENRFTVTTTYTGSPDELAAREAEERAMFERKGITDFIVSYGVESVRVSYNFAAPEES